MAKKREVESKRQKNCEVNVSTIMLVGMKEVYIHIECENNTER